MTARRLVAARAAARMPGRRGNRGLEVLVVRLGLDCAAVDAELACVPTAHHARAAGQSGAWRHARHRRAAESRAPRGAARPLSPTAAVRARHVRPVARRARGAALLRAGAAGRRTDALGRDAARELGLDA
eukprot:7268666-Prymnesium_polylepis.1